jgi:ABC-type antimicrobial peptide transport system ATPase subunit
MPAGCRFAPRCAFVQGSCHEPQTLILRDQRHVRCRRQQELELAGAMV